MASVGDVIAIIDRIKQMVAALNSAGKLDKDADEFVKYLGEVRSHLGRLQDQTLSDETQQTLEQLNDVISTSCEWIDNLKNLNYLKKAATINTVRDQLLRARNEIHGYLLLIVFAYYIDTVRPSMGRRENTIRDQHTYGRTENIIRELGASQLQSALTTPAYLTVERRKSTTFPIGYPDILPPKFKFEELRSATDHFIEEKIIGKGGSATVYEGWIDKYLLESKAHNSTRPKANIGRGTKEAIAVKRLGVSSYESNLQKSDVSLMLAEVKFLQNIQHPNVIKLLGYCRGKRKGANMLVYEYMTNGTLAEHLFNRLKIPQPLSWEQRIKIAAGVARALAHLHALHVIHRDVKPFNILLDSNFNPKLSDFGVAINGPTDRGFYVKASLAGTQRYMDPYYIATGRVNEKADVFGLGVFLIEMLTAKLACNVKMTIAEGLSDANTEITSQQQKWEDLFQTSENRDEAESLSDAKELTSRHHLKKKEASQRKSVFSFLNKLGASSFLLGKRSISECQTSALGFIGSIESNSLYEKNISEYLSDDQKLVTMMDPSLRGRYPLEAARRTVQLARSCVAFHPARRPSMEEVVDTLQQIQTMGMHVSN